MGKIFFNLFMIILLLMLFGCNYNNPMPVRSEREEFIEPDATAWAEFIAPVREYMYYRTKAVLSGDIRVLWDRYPRLQEHTDRKAGINSEKYEVESLNQSFALIDANFSPESYERIKVKEISGHEAVVLVHGSILYLTENFDGAGGEILIKLYLEKQGDKWSVVKTDEYTIPEYREWLRRQ